MNFSSHFCFTLLFIFFQKYDSICLDKVRELFGVDFNQYTFTSELVPVIDLPEIGNGHIATQMKNKYMFMNGIYNGFFINSHRAAIPSTINWNISSKDSMINSFYSLDSIQGVFKEILVYPGYNISLSSYISRVNRQILVRNVSLESRQPSSSVILSMSGTLFDSQSPDFNFAIQEFSNKFIIKGDTIMPENNHTSVLPIFIVLEKVPNEIILTNSEPWKAFITSLDSVELNAYCAFNKAVSNKSVLLIDHSKEWIETWDRGLIRVISNDSFVTKSIHAAQYYLLSSLPNNNWNMSDPSWLFYGLSPTGLAHGNTLDDYLGHVFWDMDTWMFPAILPFHNSLAIELIKYRRVMLNSAMDISKINSYKGAQYPWESARTGYETTYDPIVGKNEIHISSDISFAVQQLLWMSSKYEKSLYYDLGKDVVNNIARFWYSRLTYNGNLGKYEILNVMPPDEYVNSCNNSAFTNVAAIKSLEAPFLLAKRYHDNVTNEMLMWFQISRTIVYPYDEKLNFIPEYDGYKIGSKVKQADVVMLQYPLQLSTNEECFINNLNYYGKITDVNGPAMTWSIFSINWFNLKDSVKAEQYFRRNLDYIISPYYIWSEIINGQGARNFITGMGGYLQNILNGYMGLRLTFIDDGQLIIDPTMTTLINFIMLHNVTFQNSNIDIEATPVALSIMLLNEYPIFVFAAKDKKTYLLTNVENKISLSSQRIVITSAG